ncbi:hypothetical protein Tco_0993415 [Tanacetum coccineum]|uniref:Uncharacterized protein n=1 Tax=Tanacetum coccineum TaxID=301880 RepID=A0ABQ5F4W4_9ASTR
MLVDSNRIPSCSNGTVLSSQQGLFPVCLGFTLIVIYDAIGACRYVGMQAEDNHCLEIISKDDQVEDEVPIPQPQFMGKCKNALGMCLGKEFMVCCVPIRIRENDRTSDGKSKRGGSLLALKCLVWFMKYYANVRRTVADFSHAPLNEYSPSPDDKKQWSLVWFDFYKIPLCTLMTSRRLFKLHQCFRICLR